MMLKYSFMLIIILALLAPGVAHGDSQEGATQPSILRGTGVDQHVGDTIPLSATFVDEANCKAPLSSLLRGKPVLLVLVQFRCPSLCSAILNDLLGTLKVIPQNLGTDYDVWIVSFDPREDASLARQKKDSYLRTYLRTRPNASDASSGWHFLTGTEDNIHQLTLTTGYRYRFDEGTQQFVHPAAVILLTPEGRISRYFYGINYEPTDVRLSLVEASQGKTGTWKDQVLLYCYHYDPATGRYGLAVVNVLKILAGLTLLALAATLTLLWRADQRRTRRLAALEQGGAT